MKRILSATFFPIIVLLSCTTTLWAQTQEQKVVSLSDSIGHEIDKAERSLPPFPRYQRFPIGANCSSVTFKVSIGLYLRGCGKASA